MKTFIDQLARHPFLRNLDEHALQVAAEGAEEVRFNPGEVIFQENEPANRFYLIEEGRVALEARSEPNGRVIQQIGSGDVLGWSWLFPPFAWVFRARALAPTRAISLDGGHLLVASEENYDFGYDLMKRIVQVVIERLQAARQQLIESGADRWVPSILSAEKTVEVPENVQAAIGHHPFFAGMSAEQLRLLAKHAMRVQFEPGQIVFKTGDPANRFYLIEHGRVALEAPSEQGPVLIQIIGEGDVLGWSWLFEPYLWHFDARALQPVSAIFFYGTPLREGLEGDHELGYALMRRISQVVIQRLQATRKHLIGAELQPQSLVP